MLILWRNASSAVSCICRNARYSANATLKRNLSANVNDHDDDDDHTSGSDSSSESDGESWNKSEETRHRILKASLEFVPEYGWSRKALAAGAEKVGFPSTTHGLFSRGGGELVHFFTKSCNDELSKYLVQQSKEKADGHRRSTTTFIQSSLEVRLQMLGPYLNHWPQAMALMILPENTVDALTNLSTMVDDIWFYAGDRSTDISWYTKRGSLAVLYKTTELYMTQDNSDGYQQTFRFLDSQLKNLEILSKCSKQCQSSTDYLWSALQVTRNMLSLNDMNR